MVEIRRDEVAGLDRDCVARRHRASQGRPSSPRRARSCASPNFSPLPENTLMPLSVYGLCDADSTTPRSKSSARVRNATPGVGITPALVTRRALAGRAARELARDPLARLARVAADDRAAPAASAAACGRARRRAGRPSADRAVHPATPRTPSVPNSRVSHARPNDQSIECARRPSPGVTAAVQLGRSIDGTGSVKSPILSAVTSTNGTHADCGSRASAHGGQRTRDGDRLGCDRRARGPWPVRGTRRRAPRIVRSSGRLDPHRDAGRPRVFQPQAGIDDADRDDLRHGVARAFDRHPLRDRRRGRLQPAGRADDGDGRRIDLRDPRYDEPGAGLPSIGGPHGNLDRRRDSRA